MQFIKTVVLILIILSMLVLTSPGQSPSSTQPVATPTPTPTATPSTEIEILREQLKISKEYNDKITGSFATLIQTAIGVFALLGGISWFSAVKLRQSERKVLREQIDNREKQLLAEFDGRISTLTAGYEEKLTELGTLALSSADEVLRKTSTEVALLNHRLVAKDATQAISEQRFEQALLFISACVALSKKVDSISMVQDDLRRMLVVALSPASQPINLSVDVYRQIEINLRDLPPQVTQTLGRVVEALNNLLTSANFPPETPAT